MIIKTFIIAIAVVNVAAITSCTAHADPPPFPDLNSYTAVNVKDYAIDTTSPGHPSTATYFLTPDGIACNFVSEASSSEAAQCVGNNFPNIPPASSDPARGINGVNWIMTDFGLRQTSNPISPDNTIRDQPIKTLPPLHSITVNGVICGVDDTGMTACKDPQGRGFILSPSWSGWLPHV